MLKSLEEPTLMDTLLQNSKTLDARLQHQLTDKYRTFTRFNYRQAYLNAQRKSKKKAEQVKNVEPDIAMALQTFLKNSLLSEGEPPEKKGKGISFEELPGVKSERRERFKQTGNTFFLIRHYIEKEGFKPKEEENYLMTQLAQIKQYSDHSSLENLLKKIYRVMNEAVDLNQLRFLCLLVMLAADVSLQFRELNRAFYFYNQARLFASYAKLYQVKIEALSQLGIIAVQMRAYSEALLLFKKALQYAWKMRNQQAQLLIYDHMGNACYYQGNIRDSQYYHRRFAQGECEQQDSAIKRLSSQILQEYCTHLQTLECEHLTSLFLQYIQIPIVDHNTVPPPSEHAHKQYDNYDEQGLSPRRKKMSKVYNQQDFPLVLRQLSQLLQQDQEFRTEIPNPDVQRNFIAMHRFGRPRKEIAFEQSAECHKLTRKSEGKKEETRTLQVDTFERRLEKAMTARNNDDWWGAMKDRIRKGQAQKIGTMKDRIYNSHQSYAKYPEERRRAYSLRGEKIKQSFNKTLLDWIDPPK